MIILLSLIAIALLKIDSTLLAFTTETAATLQNKCELLSPLQFENHQWISAVVCGRSPAQNPDYRILQASGLLHLIVVSGSHLVFIEQILSIIFQNFRWSFGLKIFVLAAFALFTGFQPPVVRALCSNLIDKFQTSNKLFWSPPAITYIAGLVVLMFAPKWWSSISLQLSWVAALALQTVSASTSYFRLKQQLAVFVLMFPLLMQFAPPHPISIVFNVVAGPIIGAILFPVSALTLISADWFWFVDDLWNLFFRALHITVPDLPMQTPMKLGSPIWIWLYIFALNTYLIFKKQLRE